MDGILMARDYEGKLSLFGLNFKFQFLSRCQWHKRQGKMGTDFLSCL